MEKSKMRHYDRVKMILEQQGQGTHLDWNHKFPRDYFKKMVKVFGPARFENGKCAGWFDIGGFDMVKIIDEMVPHSFPAPHYDYVYSAKTIDVPPDMYSDFGKVTGSIIIDGLKRLVFARCGGLYANAVTLGFVEDVVFGKAKATKAEYSKRIKGGKIPDWYEDQMKEG